MSVRVVVFLLYQQSVRDHRNSASHTGDDDDVQRHSISNNDKVQEFSTHNPNFPRRDTCAMSNTEGHGQKSQVVIRVKKQNNTQNIGKNKNGKRNEEVGVWCQLKVFGANMDLRSCKKAAIQDEN